MDRDGKLCELNKPLDRDCTLRMITAVDRPGRQTYERSVVFLMLAAFYDTVGTERVQRISVEYSISRALFIRAKGDFILDQALLDRVEERMRQLVRQAVPIRKSSLCTEDAVQLFRSRGMLDKAQLLRFRISSRVNVYSLEDFFRLFLRVHGPGHQLSEVVRPPDLRGRLRPAAARPAGPLPPRGVHAPHQGLPGPPRRRPPFGGTPHLQCGGDESADLPGGATQMILSQEALMEKQIGDIAEEIAKRRDVRFVMIAGPSSSGKTTFSHRLSTQLLARGMRPPRHRHRQLLQKPGGHPRDENGQYDFEGLGAMDVEQFNRDMVRLLNGETVELPHFNFKRAPGSTTAICSSWAPRTSWSSRASTV